jgi:hypothetical protein
MRLVVIVFISVLLFCAASHVLHAGASDSLTTIYSLYSNPDKELGPVFISTANGDTAVMAFTSQVNRDTSATDTFAIRVRSWNSLSKARISMARFYCVQSYLSRRPIIQLVLLKNLPSLIYTPSPSVLSIANVFTGKEIRRFSFTYDITRVTYSRDNTYSFVTTGTNNFYIVNNTSGEIVLSDSTEVDRISIKGDSLTRQTVACVPENWTLDNSLVMLRISKLVLRYSNGDGLAYSSVWQPFDIEKRQYIKKTFDFQRLGWWVPDAKKFFNFNSRNVYITDLTGHVDSTQNGLITTIIDYGWVSGSDRFTLIDLNNRVSVWNANPITKVIDFVPGALKGYAFNQGGTKLAYVTDDNTLRVIDTRSLQGIHTLTLDFANRINLADRSTLRFVNGDRAMVVQDKDNRYRILNLAAATTVATVDSTSVWQASQDGTALFVLEDRISRYDLFAGKKLSEFPDNEFTITIKGISISPDGRHLVCHDSTQVTLWSLEKEALISQRQFYNVQRLLWSPDTSRVFVIQKDSLSGVISINGLNGSTLEKVFVVTGGGEIRFLEFCDDNRRFLMSSGDSLLIRDVNTGIVITALSNASEVTAANLNSDGIHLAIGDINGDIRVINLNTKSIEYSMNASRTIRSVKLSPSRTYIEYVSDAGMQVLSIPDGMLIQELSTPTVDDLFIGDSLCLGIYNTAIVEFTLPRGRPSAIESGTRAHFRSDRKYYAKSGFQVRDSLKIYNYKTKQLERFVPDIASDDVLCWSADGSTLATLDLFNNVTVWRPTILNNIDDVGADNIQLHDNQMVFTYPNPCSSYQTIRSELSIEEIRIDNMLGATILKETVYSHQTTIDISSMVTGQYSLGVKTRMGWTFKPLTVSHF